MKDLPQGWRETRLGELGRYLNGYAFNAKTWSKSGRPIIRIQNLTGSSNTFNFFEGDIADRYVVRNGDLLISWAATLGAFIWRGEEAVLNQHIFKVESHINLAFHRYLIDQKLDEMMRVTHGSGMVHITKGNFDNVSVALPPLAEQERIVEILEEQFSRLDSALASIKAVREKSKALRRSLLHSAFSGELTGGTEGWQTKSLGEWEDGGVVKLGRGKIISKRDIAANPGDYPIYSSAGLNGGEFGRYGSYLFDEELITWSVDGGGHLFHRPMHKFSVTNVGGWLRILDSEVFGYKFLTYVLSWLQSTYPFDWSRKAHPSVIRVVYEKVVAPPLATQERIVSLLEEQFSRLDKALEVANQLEARIASERRSLLHSAFTGALTSTWRQNND